MGTFLKWLFVVACFGILSILIFFPSTYQSRLPAYATPTPSPNASLQLGPALLGNVALSVVDPKPKSGLPTWLRIPKINIYASIELVGLTPNGTMDITRSLNNVAWFKLGARPGQKGSAVIAGHYGWRNGEESVFDNLYKLSSGDKIYVENDKGESVVFVVRESRRYDPQADASAVFDSGDDLAHLNLITCDGVWNKVDNSYSQRLVVFTDKEI